MLRLSFIVPFYGVEQYIEECIRSLYDQDIPMLEYEVICVDDCSLDGSRAIVERLQKEYSTLKLLTHAENKCQGGARNTGLREAKGKYIWFVDSDDYIKRNCLKELIEFAEKNVADVVQFNYQSDRDVEFCKDTTWETITGEEYLLDKSIPNWAEKLVGPWCQIYSREFLLRADIRFVEKVQYEDTDFVLATFIAAKRAICIPIYAYFYRHNEGSTVHTESPVKLAWKVNQMARCAQLKTATSSEGLKMCISEMLVLTFSYLRGELKKLSITSLKLYRNNLDTNINLCHEYMNWRTWLAIRYGITWFI